MEEMKDFMDMKTVFLDIDDTLWWFTENSKVAMRHVFHENHLDDFCAYEKYCGIYLKINGELWEKYHHGEIEKDYLVNERFRFTLEQCGYTGNCDALAQSLNTQYLSYLATLPTIVPGAKELLEYLNAKGYAVHTLSNGFQGIQQQKLRSGGILHLVDQNILSDTCGITKPLPGIFLYAQQETGALPESTVMIGDNPEADIEGAHNAGWRTIYFNIKGIPAKEGTADAEVKHLTDIKNIL